MKTHDYYYYYYSTYYSLLLLQCAVELREYAKTHPFAGTQFADNICAFSTERYAVVVVSSS